MFSRKKQTSGKSRERGDLSQYGLFNVDNFEVDNNDDDSGSENDDDLEAELAAITAGGGAKRKPKPKAKLIPAVNLDKMVADSMRDIGSDDDLSDDDEEDPNLLNELSEITGEPGGDNDNEDNTSEAQSSKPAGGEDQLEIVKTRLEMYRTAESNAKLAGDAMKARRYNRGFKTLQDMQRKLEAGRAIDSSEIPPEVSVKPITAKPEETLEPTTSVTRPAPSIPSPTADKSPEPQVESATENPKIAILKARQSEYKMAALSYRKSGENAIAIKFIKVAKLFEPVIKAVQEGQEVDLSNMPPPAAEFDYNAVVEEAPPAPAVVTAPEPIPSAEKEESEIQHKTEIQEDPGLIMASTIEEALQQRLTKYKEVEQAAKDEGNTSKARRFGRIIKQFEDAIKFHKLGRPVPLDELPCPPGYGPFPGVAPAPKPNVVEPAKSTSPNSEESRPDPPPRPKLKKQDSRVSGNHVNTHVMQVQLDELKQRQRDFKLAALSAKKTGDINQAREFLKIFKQFDALIDTAQGGLPVDMATLPIPPSQRSNLEDSFTFVNEKDLAVDGESDIATRLEEQLQRQIGMCKTTRDQLRAMGDVSGTNRFENLALSVQKDLDFLRLSQKKNLDTIPKFHYEMKNFNIVKCNTDLTDNQVEISVIRGINYNVPNRKDVDTYVRVDFPYPPEDPVKNKTYTIKNTDSPEYNEKYLVEIQPKNRQCQRVFKRGSVKFEIYSKGGFLRSDVLIGTVLVKLQPLETAVEIHDSFELMDGRKKVGGKLEVKIRIRDPILTKQIEQVNEKWLIIDY